MTKKNTPNGVDKQGIAIKIMAVILLICTFFIANSLIEDFKNKKIEREEELKVEENTKLGNAYMSAIIQMYEATEGCQVVTINVGTSTPRQVVDTSCIKQSQQVPPTPAPEPEPEVEDNN